MTATMTSATQGQGPRRAESAIRRRSVRAIKVYWPVSRQTLATLAEGEVAVLHEDESLAGLFRALEASPELGDFGLYTDVFEVGVGAEGFTAAPGSTPALGAVGSRSLSPTLTFTTYLDASVADDEVSRVLSRIVAAHPWEVPVVELSAPLELVSRA
ncbi:hypothetical protein ABT174_20610 [Streptomyces sparsogenes]|uniref:hypothetical protein n=1 Tax=Streptomyces sparsogenes TaxID=67365 RepID=UPI00332B4B81